MIFIAQKSIYLLSLKTLQKVLIFALIKFSLIIPIGVNSDHRFFFNMGSISLKLVFMTLKDFGITEMVHYSFGL